MLFLLLLLLHSIRNISLLGYDKTEWNETFKKIIWHSDDQHVKMRKQKKKIAAAHLCNLPWGLNESTNTTQRHTHMRLVRKRWETTTTTHKRSSCKEDHHRTEQLKWSKLWSDISSEASSNLKRGRKWDTDRDDRKGSTQPLRLARGRTWKTVVSVENERAHKIFMPLRPSTDRWLEEEE